MAERDAWVQSGGRAKRKAAETATGDESDEQSDEESSGSDAEEGKGSDGEEEEKDKSKKKRAVWCRSAFRWRWLMVDWVAWHDSWRRRNDVKHKTRVKESTAPKYVTCQQISMHDLAETNIQWMEQRKGEEREVLQQAKALAEAGVEVTDGEFLARVVRRGI
jgi:hypothetical protein